jgi:hypothetical protein
MKNFTLVAGQPGSGKTTHIKNVLKVGTLTDTLLAGTEFAALPHGIVVGTRHRLPSGRTITAIGDFTKDQDLYLAGGDVFYRLNNSIRTPHKVWTKMTLGEAIEKVTLMLPADEYIYDNWKCSKRLLSFLSERFNVSVVLLQTPDDVCLARRIKRVEGRARKNGRFNHERTYLSSPEETASLKPAFYEDLGLKVSTM